jgi:hypothetical protein
MKLVTMGSLCGTRMQIRMFPNALHIQPLRERVANGYGRHSNGEHLKGDLKRVGTTSADKDVHLVKISSIY